MTHEPVRFFEDRAVVRLWQHDYGVSLAIAGDYITAGMPCQWHYTGVTGVDSRTITDDNGTLYVAVPDAALAQPDTVTGYIYVHDETTGRTRYIITIEIVARPVTDDTPSADEVTYIGELVVNATASAAAAIASERAAAASEDTAVQAAADALINKLNGIEAHDGDAASHPSLLTAIQTVDSIARGRATAHVFDTEAAMNAWLLVPANITSMVTGDNLYIRDTGVPDYWWDGTAAQELEAEAPDLVDYYTKVQVNALLPLTIEQTDYDALVSAGTLVAGKIYYVVADGVLP